MAKNSVCQKQLTSLDKWTAKSVVIFIISSSQRHLKRSALCWLVSMSVMQDPSQLSASQLPTTLKCPSTTVTSWFKRKAKKLFKTICAIQFCKPSSNLQITIMANTPQTLLFTETVLVMLNVTKCLQERFLNSKLLFVCFTTRWQKNHRLQSLL